MTDLPNAAGSAPAKSLLAEDDRTRRRNRAEARFRAYGIAALGVAGLFLAILLVTIVSRGQMYVGASA